MHRKLETRASLLAGGLTEWPTCVRRLQSEDVHPAILRLGLKYSEGTIRGANARCVAMLTAFKAVLQDYSTPPNKVRG